MDLFLSHFFAYADHPTKSCEPELCCLGANGRCLCFLGLLLITSLLAVAFLAARCKGSPSSLFLQAGGGSLVAQARVAFAVHRRSVFQNKDLPLNMRAKLLNSLVMSILSFNQGTWNILSEESWQHYSGAVMGFYRSLLRADIGEEELHEWSNERVLAAIRLPSPQDLLHAAKLRYVGSMWSKRLRLGGVHLLHCSLNFQL